MLRRLFEPVDNSALIFFRIVLGIVLVAEPVVALSTGWVNETFVEVPYTFTFLGFEWLRVFNGPAIYVWYGSMAAAGMGVLLGWHYRWSAIAYALLWWGCYLMQKQHYNNHYYLQALFCSMLVFVPAHGWASLDAKRNPALRSATCLRWHVWLFAGLVLIVYAYAAKAKVYPDWLSARPLEIWLYGKREFPAIGDLLNRTETAYVVAWGGLLFDALIGPMLLWRKTRWAIVGVAVFFHLFNSVVFQIGSFPYVMLGALAFYFPAERVRRRFFPRKPVVVKHAPPPRLNTAQSWVAAAFVVFFVVNLLLPLRHHLIPGNVYWTEEGHRLSWRMMLRQKSPRISLRLQDLDSGETWEAHPKDFVSVRQAAHVAGQPDFMWAFAQELRKKYEDEGRRVAVYATSRVSLNGHPSAMLYDPEVDIARARYNYFGHKDWVLFWDKPPAATWAGAWEKIQRDFGRMMGG